MHIENTIIKLKEAGCEFISYEQWALGAAMPTAHG